MADRWWRFLGVVLLAAVVLLPIRSATAAEAPPETVRAAFGDIAPGRGAAGTVRNRPRPDYDARGVRLGAFRLYPTVSAAAIYDSNVFRSANRAESDTVARVRPSLRLESGWSRHRLVVSGAADFGFYAQNASENFIDLQAAAAGVLDIRSSLRFEAEAGAARLHEERGSVDGDGGVEPVTFARWTAKAALAGESGPIDYRVGGDFVRHDYNDVAALAGGVLNQDDRDRQAFGGFARVGYRAFADGGVFLAGRYGITDFDHDRDADGRDRDGRSQTLVAGVDLDFGGITFGQLYAGWFGGQFDDPAFEPVSGWTAGGQLTANVTPLTTLAARADRRLQPTVTAGASAFVQTEGEVTVDHELLRNLLLNASAKGQRLEFEGIDRADDIWAVGMGAAWLLNRNVRLQLRYGFDLRRSQGRDAANDWQRHTAALQLVLQQ